MHTRHTIVTSSADDTAHQRVVITGISRGIGRAIAEAFLRKGWPVIGTSTSGEISWQHPHLDVYPLRLEDRASREQFVEAVKKHGALDILINSAGINPGEDTEPGSTEKLEAALGTAVGTVAVTTALFEQIRPGGLVLNVSSRAGLLTPMPNPHITPYRAAKAVLNIYTQDWAALLAERNIRVIAYNPGWVKSDMGDPRAPKLPEQAAKEVLAITANPPESGVFLDELHVTNW